MDKRRTNLQPPAWYKREKTENTETFTHVSGQVVPVFQSGIPLLILGYTFSTIISSLFLWVFPESYILEGMDWHGDT